jgi:tryptophan 2-monooxygenase
MTTQGENMRPGFEARIPYVANVSADPWLPDYPNPPDLRFNYYRLLANALAAKTAIAKAPVPTRSVGIIGAGIAGLTAARELWRAGYQVVIYEASDRVSGRLFTVPQNGLLTSYEMGAMRMPFFNDSSVAPQKSQNCLLSYYLNADQTWAGNPNPTAAVMSPFPNPGKASGNTGIFIDDGYGPNEAYSTPTLTMWPAGGQPANADLQNIAKKVDAFVGLFTAAVGPAYVGSNWSAVWQSIANNYDKMSFSDLVFTQAITKYNNDGWFGGLGMNENESNLFYTIGSGDGSWGAFYGVGAMWFIRCVMFGYNSNLQSVTTLSNAPSLPYYGKAVVDSAGTPLTAPLYRGIQALSELMLYLTPPGSARSLYEACADPNDQSAFLYVRTPVGSVKNVGSGIALGDANGKPLRTVQHVIVAAPIWAAELSIDFSGFDRKTQFPAPIPTAMAEQHLIASCKVFFPLKGAYWNQGSKIPQIIVSDTFIQDAYGVSWNGNSDAAILASYTWEDDAVKLLATDAKTLANQVLQRLDGITASTLGEKLSSWVSGPGVVFQWTQQPTYRGCAKLYRQRNWDQCYDLITYNQTFSASSRLYLAGESYGVEGGWTEPALRTALDAVIHLVQNTQGSFLNGFTFANYPSYVTGAVIDERYPQTSA